MAELSPDDTAPVTAVDSTLSRGSEDSEHSANARPCDASTAKAIVDIASFLGGGRNPPLTIQDLLAVMERLNLALSKASERVSDQEVRGASTARLSSADRSVMESIYWKEAQRLDEIHEGRGLKGDKNEILNLIANNFVNFPHWTYQGPIFRLHLRPESKSWDRPCDRVVMSKHSEQQSIHKIFTRFKAQHDCELMPGIPTQWCPPQDDPRVAPGALKHAAGNIWWITDDPKRSQSFGVHLDRGRSRTMDINAIAFLAECFYKDCPGESRRNEDQAFQQFIVSFSNISHHLAKRSLHRVYFTGSSGLPRLALQYHSSHLAPVGSVGIPTPSLETEGLVLERQFFKIRRVSHVLTQSCGEKSHEDQHFAQRILSISLTMNQHGTFQLVALGDIDANVDTDEDKEYAFRKDKKTLDLDLYALGKETGLTHFLIALIWLMETWNQGWNDTLDGIDDTIGFHGDHTFDEDQLESHIFDSSSSMALSKQYFTVLQLLRTARQQIDMNLAEWQAFCGKDRDYDNVELFMEATYGHKDIMKENFKSWEMQRDKVTQLLKVQTEHLKGRIDRKMEEVESLREGLFNATSLREAMKGMALNRAIYVFTVVTILYTRWGLWLHYGHCPF